MARLSRGSKAFLIVVVLLAVLLGGGVLALGLLFDGVEAPGEPVQVMIPEGAGAGEIGDLLADRGVVRSSLVFRIRARLDGRAGRIKAGEYELTQGMGAGAVLDALVEGPPPPETFRVLVREGLTVEQTLEALAAEESPLELDELRAALGAVALPAWVPSDELPDDAEPFEGLLFPDTYEFPMEAEAQEVISRLVRRTERILDEVAPDPEQIPSGLERYELLTLASLIEREARLDEERRTISSVLHNRLAEGMRLEIDATVLYALGEHKERVLYSDLEVDSPWNTYQRDGLPPTPISGVGRAAIEAAADPESTDYLFYVVVDPETGRHGFSRTHEEHIRRRSEAQQQ